MIDLEGSLLRRWQGLRIIAVSLGLSGVLVGSTRLAVEVFVRGRP